MLVFIGLSSEVPVQLHCHEHPVFDLTGITMLGAQDVLYKLLLQHGLHQAKTKKKEEKRKGSGTGNSLSP